MLLSSHMYTAALRGKISDIVFGMSVPGLQILKGNYSSICHHPMELDHVLRWHQGKSCELAFWLILGENIAMAG